MKYFYVWGRNMPPGRSPATKANIQEAMRHYGGLSFLEEIFDVASLRYESRHEQMPPLRSRNSNRSAEKGNTKMCA
ncbi:hypothetical protein GWI33_008026 [Rhynchophorus ferrugineus]|uniref:Uncharacterized protein n=1 Tax=Rhynchophorus ferrugineus TaxID=354439 RepID=A0A834MK28_RHYFE|nr:hypothetical protein GWI33_008026 [Rhynchophorus ferrugineus]